MSSAPPIWLPDLGFLEISHGALRDYFGEAVEFIECNTPVTADMFQLALIDGHTDYRWLYHQPQHDYWRKMAFIASVPQDHPAWLEYGKSIPMMITASNVYKYVLFSHSPSAYRLKLTDGMTAKPDDNPLGDPTWMEFYEKSVNPAFPSAPHDLLSATFMAWGSTHENNALATFIDAFKHKYRYRSAGLTFLTPALLHKRQYLNHLTNEVFVDLPFLVAASPDGLLLDPLTGRPLALTEFKAAAAYKPGRMASDQGLFGLAFRFDWETKPYDKPKTYYMTQIHWQGLVTDIDDAYFSCWTYGCGTNVWRIKLIREYTELLLTLMTHLFDKFMTPEMKGRVPIGYFHKPEVCGQRVHTLFCRLEALTLALAKMEVTKHIDKDHCRNLTHDILKMPGPGTPRAVAFPFMHPAHKLPAALITHALAKQMLLEPASVTGNLTKISDIVQRRTSIHLLTAMNWAQFVYGFERNLVAVVTQPTGAPPEGEGDDDDAGEMDRVPSNLPLVPLNLSMPAFPLAHLRLVISNIMDTDEDEHPNVTMAKYDKAEKYLNFCLMWLYKMHKYWSYHRVPLERREGAVLDLVNELTQWCCEFVKLAAPLRTTVNALVWLMNRDRVEGDGEFGVKNARFYVTASTWGDEAFESKSEPGWFNVPKGYAYSNNFMMLMTIRRAAGWLLGKKGQRKVFLEMFEEKEKEIKEKIVRKYGGTLNP